MGVRRIAARFRLRVNPVLCDAFGYCAELAPELVSLDEWGYPVIADGAVPGPLVDVARTAARECPRRALFLEEVAAPTDAQGTARADSRHR